MYRDGPAEGIAPEELARVVQVEHASRVGCDRNELSLDRGLEIEDPAGDLVFPQYLAPGVQAKDVVVTFKADVVVCEVHRAPEPLAGSQTTSSS